MSPLLPAFVCTGGGSPGDWLEDVEVVVVEPAETTLAPVESTPFAPMLLTGMAEVPVMAAIAVVGVAVDVAVELVLVVVSPLLLELVVIVGVE